MILGKTKYCCVGNCGNLATFWTGNLIKSRDEVIAGFCDVHQNTLQETDQFNKQGCFGIYNKSLEIIKAL